MSDLLDDLDIRPALPADLAALAALHGRCFDRGWSLDELARLLDVPGTAAWVAVPAGQAGEPFGFILIRQVADEAEVLALAVDPPHRGRGVARRLLAAAMHVLATHGVTGIFLEVARDNEAALALYDGFGFHEVGVRPRYYERPGGARADALVLRWAA